MCGYLYSSLRIGVEEPRPRFWCLRSMFTNEVKYFHNYNNQLRGLHTMVRLFLKLCMWLTNTDVFDGVLMYGETRVWQSLRDDHWQDVTLSYPLMSWNDVTWLTIDMISRTEMPFSATTRCQLALVPKDYILHQRKCQHQFCTHVVIFLLFLIKSFPVHIRDVH